LAQKKKVFSSAEMLVGPYSSGFTNLVFCRPGTRILAFVNYARCYDTYMATLSKLFDCDFHFCLGKDTNGGINADYTIDIEEVNSIMKKIYTYAGNRFG
ncbi:glycosyltransferase 61 family protein, partial [Vibrio parahaemolyticus]